jgi:hypothetical protein
MLCRAIRHYAKNLRQRLVVLYLFEAGQNNKEDTAFGELQFRPFLEGLSNRLSVFISTASGHKS